MKMFLRTANKTPPSLSRWIGASALLRYLVRRPDNHRDKLGGVVLSGVLKTCRVSLGLLALGLMLSTAWAVDPAALATSRMLNNEPGR